MNYLESKYLNFFVKVAFSNNNNNNHLYGTFSSSLHSSKNSFILPLRGDL